MLACRITCKANIRSTVRSRLRSAAAGLLALAAAGCGQQPIFGSPARCHALRRDFDTAFADAVTAGADKRTEAQARYVNLAQDKFLTMQAEGCCKEKGLCPELNVR